MDKGRMVLIEGGAKPAAADPAAECRAVAARELQRIFHKQMGERGALLGNEDALRFVDALVLATIKGIQQHLTEGPE